MINPVNFAKLCQFLSLFPFILVQLTPYTALSSFQTTIDFLINSKEKEKI